MHRAKLDVAWREIQAFKLKIEARRTVELEIDAVTAIDALSFLVYGTLLCNRLNGSDPTEQVGGMLGTITLLQRKPRAAARPWACKVLAGSGFRIEDMGIQPHVICSRQSPILLSARADCRSRIAAIRSALLTALRSLISASLIASSQARVMSAKLMPRAVFAVSAHLIRFGLKPDSFAFNASLILSLSGKSKVTMSSKRRNRA